MLDILILSALPQRVAQPVEPAPAKESAVEQLAPQHSSLAKVQPAISTPESILPRVQSQPKATTSVSGRSIRVAPSHSAGTQSAMVAAKGQGTIAAPTAPTKGNPPQNSAASPSGNAESYTPVSLPSHQLGEIDTRRLPTPTVETPEQAAKRKAFEAAKAERLKLLEQKLAELVESEKPLKQELLRQNLRNAALNYAKAGQLDQARGAAQDLMLSPSAQAELLTQIAAIASERNPSASTAVTPKTLPTSNRLPIAAPEAPTYLLPNSLSSVSPAVLGTNFPLVKPWKLPGGISLLFPLPFPVPMTSGFGWRIHPITGQQRFHSGVDLAAPLGTPVVAAFSGRVEVADWMDGYGLTIILSPKNGKQEVLYGHLSALFVKPGQWVEQGTLIGQVGSTGLSTGPHLHFELRQLSDIGWAPIDPTMQLGAALAKIGEYVAIAQLPETTTDTLPTFATIPPPPTQKFPILHNF